MTDPLKWLRLLGYLLVCWGMAIINVQYGWRLSAAIVLVQMGFSLTVRAWLHEEARRQRLIERLESRARLSGIPLRGEE